MAVKKEIGEQIIIPALKLKTFDLHLVGDSPLISHAWSHKAKQMILDKQQMKAKSGKEPRNPAKEYAESLYWLSEKPNFDEMSESEIMDAVEHGRFGFPVLAFKASAIDGAYQQGAIEKKTTARGAVFAIGEFAEIIGKPRIREDMVRIGMGTSDLRYRAEFPEWETTLRLRINEGAISMTQVVNMFNIGGFSNGVGEWRPSKDGMNGQYHVA
jgi:hypothetical protein